MYTNILVPTDGTEFCERAVDHGISLAKLFGGKVTGVTVTVPLRSSIAASLPSDMLADFDVRTAAAAKQALDKIATKAKTAGVTAEVLTVKDEQPWRGIIEAGKKHRCDLIVMASHGRRGLSAVVLGSETQKVITHSTIPVLVCR